MVVRIVSGIIMALFFVLILVSGQVLRMLALALIMLISHYEMTKALRTMGLELFALPGYAFILLFIPTYSVLGPNGIWALFAIMLMAALCSKLASKKITILSIFNSLLPFIYPHSLFVIILLSASLPEPMWRSVLISGIASACFSDIAALFVGMKFGKTKLAPDISPKKTVEGAVGGLIGGVVSGITVFALQGLWNANYSFWIYMLSAITGSITGQIGDLVASAIKRESGIKDFGNLIPGHGGVLDRMDSILFSMPMAYIFFGIFTP